MPLIDLVTVAFREGRLTLYVRAFDGGEPEPAPRSVWFSERLRIMPRFFFGLIDLNRPFGDRLRPFDDPADRAYARQDFRVMYVRADEVANLASELRNHFGEATPPDPGDLLPPPIEDLPASILEKGPAVSGDRLGKRGREPGDGAIDDSKALEEAFRIAKDQSKTITAACRDVAYELAGGKKADPKNITRIFDRLRKKARKQQMGKK